MKTAIVYHSEHHGNTKKLLDEIAKQPDVILLEAEGVSELSLAGYDVIGFASGIYYQKLHQSVLDVAKKSLPLNKKTFVLYTYGVKRKGYADAITGILEEKDARLLGVYNCPGYDTFGPFKLVGGIDKGRPNEEDIAGAVAFFREISKG